MKRYSLLQPLYRSFFSRDLYRDVRANWKGTGFLYLLLLLAITWLPVMIKVHADVSAAVRLEAPKYIEQVPEITVVKGQVSVDQPVPYTLSDPETSAPLVVIDTSGTITSFEQTTAPVLLTENKLMYRKPRAAETRIYDLTAIEELTIDRDGVAGWVEMFRKYFAFVAYPFALAGTFAYRVLQMLLYAAIGLLFVKMLKAELDYLTLLRLASVAITPVIILNTLRTLTGYHVPALGALSFAVAMGYLFFAVKVNAEPERPGAPAV